MSQSPWKTISSNTVYKNPWIQVSEDKIIHPDGKEGIYGYMEAIPGVIVLVEDDKGIYFINEYKYPLKKWIWNLVTGGVGLDEDPLERAKIEILEEMGITATDWTRLGIFYSSPAVDSTKHYIFLARDLVVNENRTPGMGDEAIRAVKKLSLTEIYSMIKRGKIESGLVLGALMQYFSHTGK